MREILFRGFHLCDGPDTIVVNGEKVKGKWVEGYIVRHPSAIQIGNDYSPWYIHVPPVDPDDNGGVFNVLPSTVGQWTGKIDKHEKKVFSGDKVYYSHENRIYSVEWNDSLLRWEGLVGWIAVPLYQFVDSCEVIGTVFDEEAPNET